MDRNAGIKSALLIIGIAAVVVIGGLLYQSSPSEAVAEKAVAPTTTTTTEPPTEGSLVVRISNGSFRPSNVKLDLDVAWIVRWVNDDPVEYMFADKSGLFETMIPVGGEFEFDYSAVPPGIYRVFATIGNQRIPGTIDSRPQQ